jgi:hypothetical protein
MKTTGINYERDYYSENKNDKNDRNINNDKVNMDYCENEELK